MRRASRLDSKFDAEFRNSHHAPQRETLRRIESLVVNRAAATALQNFAFITAPD
jgi:hypothetical protein